MKSLNDEEDRLFQMGNFQFRLLMILVIIREVDYFRTVLVIWWLLFLIITALLLPTSKCALLDGLQLCVRMGRFQVDIELDSLVHCYPWAIQMEIRSIFEQHSRIDFFIVHTYIEINIGADFFSNIGCKESRRTTIYF